MALSKTTKDHDEIQRWAESRNAKPSEVASTHSANEPGILRFQFPRSRNRNDANLREIEWEEFFRKFDENNLALLYQDVTSTGKKSNFNKLIHPQDAHASGRRSRARSGGSERSGESGSGHASGKTSGGSSRRKKAA